MSKKLFISEEDFQEKMLAKTKKVVKEFNKSEQSARIFFNPYSMLLFFEAGTEEFLSRFRESDNDCCLAYKNLDSLDKITTVEEIKKSIQDFEI